MVTQYDFGRLFIPIFSDKQTENFIILRVYFLFPTCFIGFSIIADGHNRAHYHVVGLLNAFCYLHTHPSCIRYRALFHKTSINNKLR